MMRAYRALLCLYPASFRSEYGEEMCHIFAERRFRAGSALSIAALWICAFFEIVFSAAQVHADILRQDLGYTARSLRRNAGFALTTVLVTALAVGANTAIFSVTDHVLIRPLPFKDSDRIVKLWESTLQSPRQNVSPPNYRDWQRMSSSFEAMGAYAGESATMIGDGEARRLQGVGVSSGVFAALSARPFLGRIFTEADERAGAGPVIVLSHALWITQFEGKADAIGQVLHLDDETYTVIGVMPANFYFPYRNIQYWTPFPYPLTIDEDRGNNVLDVVAKLKQSVSIQQASSELSLIAEQIERFHPKENESTDVAVVSLRDQIDARTRTLIVALFGAAICVLLIACTNLGSLALVRGMTRRRELAVRSALGAGRERLVRQLATESLVLAILGGIAGIIVARGILPLLVRFVPARLPIGDALAMDFRIFLFAAMSTALMGIGFGVMPAFRSSSQDLARLRARSRVRRERLRPVLLVGQVMGSIALLVAAGLLIQALWSLRAIDPGFRTENIFAVNTPLPASKKYDERSRRNDFYSRVLLQVRALPGVANAAFISYLPMVTGGGIQTVDGVETQRASMRFVTPELFSSMGIPIRMGRDVRESDDPNAPFVAVVSRSFVRQYLPEIHPIGQKFNFADETRTIVGVVGDVRVRGLERDSEPQVYLPYKQMPLRGRLGYTPRELIVRSSIPPDTLISPIRDIIRRIDPGLPLEVRRLEDVISEQTGARAAHTAVLGSFAGLSLLLTGLGIHGLLSFAVSQRLPEIGLRMALGATRRDILGMVASEGLLLASIGCALGLILGYGAGRSMESVLAGVKPADIPTLVFAVVVAFVMTLTGSLVPVMRAIRVDPTTTMRME
jgi:putative ABC transport system permease protein